MAAASDLAAMGARGVAALSSLVLPRELSDEELDRIAEGIARASDASSCPVVGGNLARGNELSITTSVLGECQGPVLRRDGAQAGDFLYVTGPVGGAALGLARLQKGLSIGELDPFTQAFLFPRARLDLSPFLAEHASSAIDVSDGLFADLTHLCRASGVRAELELSRIPTLPDFARHAQDAGLDPGALILSGGDDYEVLFTARAELPEGLGTRIGQISEGPSEVVVLDAQGQPLSPAKTGFDHFR
jgi:thiamine-monophosphate kinase